MILKFTNVTWYVSGITTDGIRHGSSDLQFKLHSSAKRFIKSNKATKYAEEHKIIEWRISKFTEIQEDDVEAYQMQATTQGVGQS